MKNYLRMHSAPAAPWTIPALCAAYQWPTDAPGGGVIGIVELGGGWNPADVAMAFAAMGQEPPDILDISVDGTGPSIGSEADGEVALDIQVAGASYFCATGKPAQIRMYWTQDIAAGIRKATGDGCDVCSISWGADEAIWGLAAGDDLEAAARDAVAAGMVVFAASGDNDSSDGGLTPANVDLPASAPSVIGCGGTSRSKAGAEVVWNNNPGNADGSGTGGGFSTLFATPPWQVHTTPMSAKRMVPDVAANADPVSGYEVVIGGQVGVVGGTSAAAPLYAGLFAAFGKKLGAIGTRLWLCPDCFNDITEGDNGTYSAAVGPDPCTGMGSPIGAKLAEVFVKMAVAP